MTTRFRSAEPEDAEAIAALHADSWRRSYRGIFLEEFLDGDLVAERRAVWRARLEAPADNQFVWVADDGGQIAGFVCAYAREDAEWGSLIDNLHVSVRHRRRGIASSVMRAAGAWLASAYPDCGVYLWVLEANTEARRFYDRLGGHNAGTLELENPSGGVARSCRYVWDHPDALGQPSGTAG